MKREIVEAATMAFARRHQFNKALNAALKLKVDDDRDKLLGQLLNYYLNRATFLNYYGWLNHRKSSKSDQKMILKYFKAAHEVARQVNDFDRKFSARKNIIEKGLRCLNRLGAKSSFVNKFAKFLYGVISGVASSYPFYPEKKDKFVKRIIRSYLRISRLKGSKIVEIAKLMSTEARGVEEERLLDIFIGRGDFEALKLLKEENAYLEQTIQERSEEILLSCLKRKRMGDAIKSLSFINPPRRWAYCNLLGIPYKDYEEAHYKQSER